MTPAPITPFAAPVDSAWTAYAAHRSKEEREPALADDPAHIAEGARLHAIFTELFTGESSDVVVPFRRRREG